MSGPTVPGPKLTSDERATFQALVDRGVPRTVARELALDGVHVNDVRDMALDELAKFSNEHGLTE